LGRDAHHHSFSKNYFILPKSPTIGKKYTPTIIEAVTKNKFITYMAKTTYETRCPSLIAQGPFLQDVHSATDTRTSMAFTTHNGQEDRNYFETAPQAKGQDRKNRKRVDTI
jgi:hypothetical protein